MSDNRTCKTCQFYSALLVGGGQMTFVCRFRPPEVFAQMFPLQNGTVGTSTATAWPGVSESDWCGSHSFKAELLG